jgi:hypothetical protein
MDIGLVSYKTTVGKCKKEFGESNYGTHSLPVRRIDSNADTF